MIKSYAIADCESIGVVEDQVRNILNEYENQKIDILYFQILGPREYTEVVFGTEFKSFCYDVYFIVKVLE